MDTEEFLQECEWFDWDIRDICDELSPIDIEDEQLAQLYTNLQATYFEFREYLSNVGYEL